MSILLLLLVVVVAAGKQGRVPSSAVTTPAATPASQHPLNLFSIQTDLEDQTSAVGTGSDLQPVHALINRHRTDTEQRRLTVANLYKIRTSGFCGDSGGQWGPIEAKDNLGAIFMCIEAATVLEVAQQPSIDNALFESQSKPRGCYFNEGMFSSIYFNNVNPNVECNLENRCICTTRVCRFGDETININRDCDVVAATTVDSGTKTIVGHNASRPVLNRGFDGSADLKDSEQFDRHFVVTGTAELVLVRVKLVGALVGKKGSGTAPTRTGYGESGTCGDCRNTPCTTMRKFQKPGTLCGNCANSVGNCACCSYTCETPTCDASHKGHQESP